MKMALIFLQVLIVFIILSFEFHQSNCYDFIAKDEWSPNSADINPLDYHIWGKWRSLVTS